MRSAPLRDLKDGAQNFEGTATRITMGEWADILASNVDLQVIDATDLRKVYWSRTHLLNSLSKTLDRVRRHSLLLVIA